jgi:hypothetical protein
MDPRAKAQAAEAPTLTIVATSYWGSPGISHHARPSPSLHKPPCKYKLVGGWHCALRIVKFKQAGRRCCRLSELQKQHNTQPEVWSDTTGNGNSELRAQSSELPRTSNFQAGAWGVVGGAQRPVGLRNRQPQPQPTSKKKGGEGEGEGIRKEKGKKTGRFVFVLFAICSRLLIAELARSQPGRCTSVLENPTTPSTETAAPEQAVGVVTLFMIPSEHTQQ